MYFVQKDDLPLSWYLVKAAETDSEITYNVTVGLEHSNRLSESVVLYKTGQLQDLALVKFHKMDSWFEEDEEIFSEDDVDTSTPLTIDVDNADVDNESSWMIEEKEHTADDNLLKTIFDEEEDTRITSPVEVTNTSLVLWKVSKYYYKFL